ncbi:MAG: hypothetical protein R3F11_08910 [Verrucomicrobiales bacterium]
MIGARDEISTRGPEWQVDRGGKPFAEADTCTIYQARWPAIGDGAVAGAGLWIEPKGDPRGYAIVIPDAGQNPEELLGLDGWPGGDRPGAGAPLQLAARGYAVAVPYLIGRTEADPKVGGREFLNRSAFELGRTVIGYEVQKVRALAAWMSAQAAGAPVAVAGYGEGGLIALYAAALDERITGVLCANFGPQADAWAQTADRNLFGRLPDFGDAEIAAMVAPRRLVLANPGFPEVRVPAGSHAKPGYNAPPSDEAFHAEAERLRSKPAPDGWDPAVAPADPIAALCGEAAAYPAATLTAEARPDDPAFATRAQRQFDEINTFNQRLLATCAATRAAFAKDLRFDSLDAFAESSEKYRQIFADDVIGRFDLPLAKPNPRSRAIDAPAGLRRYEIVLDVYPGLFAYGILTVPDGIAAGERRPCVVCQHGLEGRPQDVISGEGSDGWRAYKGYATALAQEGFVTFAPQNLYIFRDRFRVLQFKANAIGKTLFSLIIPQHQQIVNWLGEQPFIDRGRIAFYGLSYGGKSAMRIPPLVPEYCLSICSADFNEWVWKTHPPTAPTAMSIPASMRYSNSSIPGSTFNYAGNGGAHRPAPFMVERYHFDGVAP